MSKKEITFAEAFKGAEKLAKSIDLKLLSRKPKTMKDVAKEMIANPEFRAELYIGKKGKFYYRVLGRNNKVVIPSEPYNTRQSALKTLKRIQGLNFWGFKDLTKVK